MADVLIYGDTERNSALRHQIPLAIGDPFMYAEVDGRRYVLTNTLEADRIRAVDPGLEQLLAEELGVDELIAAGLRSNGLYSEIALRACQRIGLRNALVPADFPLAVADHLRAAGIELTIDGDTFDRRRRNKTSAELAGIRRAGAAAVAGMTAAAGLLRSGKPLTAEQVRDAIREACRAGGAPAPPDIIVAPGAQGASGHDPGSGPLPEGTPIIIDLWPRDELSGCHADMTRTFVIGEVPEDVAEMHALALESLDAVRAAARPGITGTELYGVACEPFEAAGHPTQRTKPPGTVLTDGFFHGLGHGVGLEVHEQPALGRTGAEPLVDGDVVAIEPGMYRSGYGGVRLEDTVIVGADGCEALTPYPYDLTP